MPFLPPNRQRQSTEGKALARRNRSQPKVTINDAMKFFSQTAISMLVISIHNTFRVLFDKIASVYFI